MQSNELSREQRARTQAVDAAPKLPDALKQKTQAESQDAQKRELILQVMEARLDRLKNYKLTWDSKLWDSDYPERAKKTEACIAVIKGSASLDTAMNELAPQERSLMRPLIAQNNILELQKSAIALMRADNGSDQVEAIAARNLWDLFDKGVKRLEGDTKAQAEIERRANRDFGDMMKQGVFDGVDEATQQAAKVGLKAMYQMRYIAKEYIDEKWGVPVPEDLKHVWENYRDSLDIKDEWSTFSDTGKTQIASFLAYDLAPMIISGGVAGAVGKVAISAATRATASMAIRMPAAAKYISSGTKVASLVKWSTTVAGRAALATGEAATFDFSFELLRNQRLFTDKPNWQQDLIKNAFGFGFSRYLAGAKSFPGIQLDPLSNQLIKQGLIVPAIITGVWVGQKLLANDPDAYHGAWEEFILGAVMTGAFHMSGRVLEKRFPAKEMGVQKVEITPDGSQAVVTTPDGKKFTTRMTEKLKTAFSKLRKAPESDFSSQNHNPVEVAHGAPLEPVGPNVAKAENGGKLPEVKPPMAKPQTNEGPKNGDRMSVEGKEYRWSAKDKVWRWKWWDTLPQAEVLAAKDAKGNQLLIEYSRPWVQVEGAPKSVAPEAPKWPYRNESRLAKLQEWRRDSETLLQKLQTEYARLRDAFHIPSDKQLKFDYFHTSETGVKINTEMRVVNVGENMIVQVKNNGVWEVATEQNIIPKSPNARAEYDAYVQHQKDLLRSGVHNQIPDDVISMIDSWDLFKKQLSFDFYKNGNNSKMRVIELPNNEYLVQVKNNGVWEVATEQNVIPTSPNAKAEYDAYVQHQKDLLRSGVHNQFMKPEELNQQLSDVNNRLQRMDSLIQRESARPVRPVQNNESQNPSHPNNTLWQQSTLSHSDTVDPHAKTRIEKEHGLDGSRQRYTEADIIKEWDLIIPGAGADIPGAVAKWPNGVREFIDKYKRHLPWLLLIPLLLVAIRSSNQSPEDKRDMESICEECLTGKKSFIDEKRIINGHVATRKYREAVTQRWMQSKEWKDFVKDYNSNKAILSGLTNPNQKSVVTALDAVLTKDWATVENVQTLQHCIGMFKEVSSGGRYPTASLDHKEAQDGMLGHITTNELIGFVRKCTIEKASV